MKKKIGILTSGGDAPGMNAAIRAAVRTGIFMGAEVYGIKSGYEGLIDGNIEPMTASSVSDILHRGGTILRTARSERFMTSEGRQKAAEVLRERGIEDLVIIGGDGSLNGGMKLSELGINVMGIPGTIDNDMAYTERTIGFDTAVNTALSAISNVRDTSSSHERTTIIEVMGRNCGDIAVWAGTTSGAESILIPEVPVDIENVCRKVTQGRKRGKLHNIIVKAEGVRLDSGVLAKHIMERTGMETKIVVLGHVQRGGSPTAVDRMLASSTAFKAVELIADGSERNQAVGMVKGEIVSIPLEKALKAKKTMDMRCVKMAEILSI
ncbi:MAG TPA: 6-phosphofructokinase [Candidatus Copromorpha excrementigallinarum]|uniref:ATP-dependent 6-phosphofructokinase n=1 Tax=Candidatus Allocopromorpha excrementigallinarum TaxID=2840742 RepID=A0A9D1L5K8_9FIRM|nr:6-phosphofructokinase [Candidatus Copromorpha excrementigallinarum]